MSGRRGRNATYRQVTYGLENNGKESGFDSRCDGRLWEGCERTNNMSDLHSDGVTQETVYLYIFCASFNIIFLTLCILYPAVSDAALSLSKMNPAN